MPVHNLHRLLAVIIGGTAAAFVPAPATAQGSAGANTPQDGWSKTDAILGAPSALQAILAQQNAAPRPAALPPASSHGAPTFVPAVMQLTPAVRERVTSGRPDVFGTVALQVRHTPLDFRWRAVQNPAVGAQAARFAQALREKDPFKRLEAVNWYVNRRLRFVEDSGRFGRADVWSAAGDTLRRGRGDCEDYAIAK